MEETVWIVVGIISVLLALGIVAQFMVNKSADDKIYAVRDSVDSLYRMCNSVCSTPQGTYLKVLVTLPSGSIIETRGRSICGSIDDELFCRTCPCDISENVVLNLTSQEASRFFFMHDYNCFFLREENNLDVECLG